MRKTIINNSYYDRSYERKYTHTLIGVVYLIYFFIYRFWTRIAIRHFRHACLIHRILVAFMR